MWNVDELYFKLYTNGGVQATAPDVRRPEVGGVYCREFRPATEFACEAAGGENTGEAAALRTVY